MQKVLLLEGKFVDKIWGGTRLATEFSYDINSDSVGEYWAISGMKDFSSVVINGELAGKSLEDLYQNYNELFAGKTYEDFPLLIKIIDASEDLSIQVHPDDKLAKQLENSRGKTEFWYILNEEPSSIIYGLKAQSKQQAVKLINDKKWDQVLREVPAKKGDFFFVKAGTVHAIKKGALILEIQQASDVTYRLYDYDRVDKDGNLRKLNIDKSIKSIKIEDLDNLAKSENIGNIGKTILTRNEFFNIYKLDISGKQELLKEADYLLESVIDGAGVLIVDGESYNIKKGDFFILTSEASSYKFDGDLTIIETSN